MNRVQDALIRWTGASEVIAEQRLAIEDLNGQTALLQRQLEDVSYLNIFEPFEKLITDVLPSAKRKPTIDRIRRLRHENPLAKQAIKLALRFTFGRGIDYLVNDDQAKEVWKEFWDDPVNKKIYTTHAAMKDRFDEVLTDGEKFYALFTQEGVAPYVRIGDIPMEEIVEIVYEPGNRFVPVYYKRQFVEYVYDAMANSEQGAYKPKDATKPKVMYYTDWAFYGPEGQARLERVTENIKIPQSKIVPDVYVKHLMVNPLWTKSGRRGISELFASREWFRVFKEFMEDRGAINAAANAISYQRKIKGGPTAVANMAGKFGGQAVGIDSDSPELRQLTRPVAAAVYDSNEGIDMKWMQSDTGALNAQADAQMFIMAGGAGVGTSVHYFGEGGDANLATAQAMELPMVKVYEDYQQFHENDLRETFWFVLLVAMGSPPTDEEKQISWEFPPIMTQDVVKYTTAWGQLTQQIAPGNQIIQNVAIKGALNTLDVANVEMLMPQIEEEQKRIAAEKEAARQLAQDMMVAGANNAPPNGPPGGNQPPKGGANGPPVGQKTGLSSAPDALGPDAKRLVNGKRPRIPATGPRG